MLNTHDSVDIWSAHPDFPEDPAFYRGVLDGLPTPVLVIDNEGLVVYGNRAVMEMSGRTKEEGVQTSVFEYVHPDDLEMIARAFLEIDPKNQAMERPWAPIRCRMVRSDGTAFPVEVTGRNRSLDRDVEAVVYHVAPADDAEALSAVLLGAPGRDADSFDPVFGLSGLALLSIDIAILVQDRGTQSVEVFARNTGFDAAITAALPTGEMEWAEVEQREPRYRPAASLTGQLGHDIRALGALDVWAVEVPTAVSMPRCTIVAITPDHHVSQLGMKGCIMRAVELAAIVLLRAHSVR